MSFSVKRRAAATWTTTHGVGRGPDRRHAELLDRTGRAACSIALLHDGEPVIGAIADFSTHRRLSAAGRQWPRRCARTERNRVVGRRTSPVGSARDLHRVGLGRASIAVMLGTSAMLAETRQRVLRIVGGAAYALLQRVPVGRMLPGNRAADWDVAAGVVLAREAGLDVRLWEEGTSIHVIAGSADDLRELAPIVEKFGSSRAAAIA